MTKLVRRFAAPLAALCVLMAAIAAPYMIPENPDSAVFRSGTLGLILLCAAGFPACEALRRASLRTLICGGVFGFLFALALSVGSELFVYSGLLPGLGALVRRAAVPLLAAPLFGCIAARCMLPRKDAPAPLQTKRPIPAWVFFTVILLCWLPLLLAYYPAMLNYDFPDEYAQHLTGQYTALHPLLHSAIINAVITAGEMLHSRTFGLLLMSLIQMGCFAASLAYSVAFAQRRGAPRAALAGLTALYALHPVFSVMSLSMTKDTLFASCVLALSLLAFDLLEDAEAFLASRAKLAFFVIACAGTALLRNNGVFALALLLPALCLAQRRNVKRVLALCAASAAACLAVLLALNIALSPSDASSFQLYSLPAQQLVRAYNVGSMTPQEKEELESWYDVPAGLYLHPHLADRAKGHLTRERIEADGRGFLSLWATVGAKNPRVYAEALLLLNIGSWYPDDLSHSTIYPDVWWEDKGYLQTQEYDMTEQGIFAKSFLPALRDLFERICRRNAYQGYPLLPVLFGTATPLWVLVFACCHLAAKKRGSLVIAALGALGLWFSYLLGPCTLPRYALPLFCLAPALLILSYCVPKKE